MKCKIIFFLPSLTAGGAEQVSLNIIKSLNKERFDITLVVLSDGGDYIGGIPEGIRIVHFNISRTVKSIFKISSFIKDEKPDVIFTSLIHSTMALYLSLLGHKKKPKVIYRSPNTPTLLFEKHTFFEKIRNMVLIQAYKSADVIIAQTPQMKNEIVKYLNISEEKITVFVNPVDIQNIEKKIINISNPFDESRENIVASGRLVKAKGFDILIQAFLLVLKKNPNFELHILGSERDEASNLKHLVKELNLENKVHFLGYQENPYRYYYFSDLYVLSSRVEGLPNTVLENLYLNKPIIATRCISFMSTLINDTKNGFLVDVEDIETLAEKILLYKNLIPDGSFVQDKSKETNALIGKFCEY